MATIGTVSGSKFIGTPIVYPVTADSITGATFHHVRMVVGINGKEYDFSRPVTNGETVEFDISSAFRAVASENDYSASPFNSPADASQVQKEHGVDKWAGYNNYQRYTLTKMEAWDEYIKDGEEKTEGKVSGTTGGAFFAGSLTDRERITGVMPGFYSRKPTSSPEVVFTGAGVIRAGAFSGNPAIDIYITYDPYKSVPDYNYYTVPFHRDAYEMRFINSLGVHESLHVSCLRQGEVPIQTDRYVIARPEKLNIFSRGLAVKQNDHERWRMSSGPLDEKWLQWWLHEPLMARWAWVLVGEHKMVNGVWQMTGGQWLPVHIIPEETVAGIDRTNGDLLAVEFTIEFDINGNPFV